MSKYIALESNPDMLTSFMRALGVKSPARFIDVWAFDEESLGFFPQPIIALCLLYPGASVDRERDLSGKFSAAAAAFYIKQRVDEVGNACGTLAVVHAICNNVAELEFEPNSSILEFYNANRGANSAEALADALGECKFLQSATLAVSSQGQTAAPNADDEVDSHFICFVLSPNRDRLVELDGVKQGPVDHGPCSKQDFLRCAIRVIREEMMTKTENMNFSVLALTTAAEGEE